MTLICSFQRNVKMVFSNEDDLFSRTRNTRIALREGECDPKHTSSKGSISPFTDPLPDLARRRLHPELQERNNGTGATGRGKDKRELAIVDLGDQPRSAPGA
jgi:hypothetical protein